MQASVNALNAGGWTPLSETLYEAANYYMGRNVDYGNVGPVRSVAASRTSGTINGTTYRRPATYACQKNYIVLLTDGLPTQDVSANAKIMALPNWSTNVTRPTCSGAAGSDGRCMSDLAEYLYRHDLDSSLAGLQNITTYTIGFGVDLAVGDTTFLQATAQKGGGRYFPAGDTASLTGALTQIVTEILDDATTFSTPTAPVNAFNRTQNLNDVYVSVFAPPRSTGTGRATSRSTACRADETGRRQRRRPPWTPTPGSSPTARTATGPTPWTATTCTMAAPPTSCRPMVSQEPLHQRQRQ